MKAVVMRGAAVANDKVLCHDMLVRQKEAAMELESCTTACLGDSLMPLVLGAVVIVALAVLVIAFVFMKHKK